ncbi:uncharacterized protein LOC117304826 [Asterias rubens]|uniref:uncharacterized protein LOC117304826 n=1 Tax=Asterias rubens TaxID=7604 RepID=UPI0014551D9A|nr:uncharacterized protein LOC117304826 [Asterias rubens]
MHVCIDGRRSTPAVLSDFLASAVFVCVLSVLCNPVNVHANPFAEALWIVPEDSSIDLQCKADLVRKYQPLITTRWFKDSVPVNPSARIQVENLGTLRISQPTATDHGLYICQISHWDVVVTSNEIRLHSGPPEGPLGENDSLMAVNNAIMGLPNVWAVSVVGSTCITSIWFLVVLMLRVRRSECCSKKKAA